MRKYLLLIIIALAIGILAFVFITQRKAGVGELGAPILSNDKSFSVNVPIGWTSEVVGKSNFYGSDAGTQAISLQSPDFRLVPNEEYRQVSAGAEIRVNKAILGEQTQLTTIEERLAFLQETKQVADVPLVRSIIVGEPAITYYWDVEGPPLISTFFFKDNALYGITLMVAGLRSDDIPKGFEEYKPTYEAVLSSLTLTEINVAN